MAKVERIDTDGSFLTLFRIQKDEIGDEHDEIWVPTALADDFEQKINNKTKFDSIKSKKGKKDVLN